MINTHLKHYVYFQGNKIIRRVVCYNIEDFQEKTERIYREITGNDDAYFEYDITDFLFEHPLGFASRVPSRIISRLRRGKPPEVDFDFFIPGLGIVDMEEKELVAKYRLEDYQHDTFTGLLYGEHENKPSEGRVDVIAGFPARFYLKGSHKLELCGLKSSEELPRDIVELKAIRASVDPGYVRGSFCELELDFE